MSQTRKGAEAEVQQKAEREKINATNARRAALTQMKSKVSNAKLKLSLLMNKLRVNLTDYNNTKDKVGAETDNFREKANEAYREYMDFKEQNNKEIRDIN